MEASGYNDFIKLYARIDIFEEISIDLWCLKFGFLDTSIDITVTVQKK